MTDTNNSIALNNCFDVFLYEKHFADGHSVVKKDNMTIIMTETADSYIKQVFPSDPSLAATQIIYFADTLKIRSIGQFLKEWNIEIGVWQLYDKNGDLVSEINKDKHYPIKWEEMKTHFLQGGIHINDIRILRRTKEQTSDRYLWILTLKSPHGILDIAHFDASTGELIKRTQTEIMMA